MGETNGLGRKRSESESEDGGRLLGCQGSKPQERQGHWTADGDGGAYLDLAAQQTLGVSGSTTR